MSIPFTESKLGVAVYSNLGVHPITSHFILSIFLKRKSQFSGVNPPLHEEDITILGLRLCFLSTDMNSLKAFTLPLFIFRVNDFIND